MVWAMMWTTTMVRMTAQMSGASSQAGACWSNEIHQTCKSEKVTINQTSLEMKSQKDEVNITWLPLPGNIGNSASGSCRWWDFWEREKIFLSFFAIGINWLELENLTPWSVAFLSILGITYHEKKIILPLHWASAWCMPLMTNIFSSLSFCRPSLKLHWDSYLLRLTTQRWRLDLFWNLIRTWQVGSLNARKLRWFCLSTSDLAWFSTTGSIIQHEKKNLTYFPLKFDFHRK